MCYPTAKVLSVGLILKLGEVRQEEENITKYFNTPKWLWQDLELFNDCEWKSTEDCNHYKKTEEGFQIYKFLARLNIEFEK